jgi:hypothetical protein
MHISGHLMRDEVASQVKALKQKRYLRPEGHVEPEPVRDGQDDERG